MGADRGQTKSFTGRQRVRILSDVAGTLSEGARLGGQPASAQPTPLSPLETAIQRSQNYLLSQQKPEGYWIGELVVDSTLVSDMIAYHHWDGKVDPAWQPDICAHLEVILRHGVRVGEFGLPDDSEPAPVFKA